MFFRNESYGWDIQHALSYDDYYVYTSARPLVLQPPPAAAATTLLLAVRYALASLCSAALLRCLPVLVNQSPLLLLDALDCQVRAVQQPPATPAVGARCTRPRFS